MKEKDKGKEKLIKNQPTINDNLEDYDFINRSKFTPSNNLDYIIKNLSNPRFLGSIHLKKEMNPNYSQVKDLLTLENESNLTKSLKSTIFNPITKILIASVIVFNLIWFLLVYLL
ncbi:MAG: hypothetical protein ACFFCI_09150 [Promethearchaeota archaeon]